MYIRRNNIYRVILLAIFNHQLLLQSQDWESQLFICTGANLSKNYLPGKTKITSYLTYGGGFLFYNREGRHGMALEHQRNYRNSVNNWDINGDVRQSERYTITQLGYIYVIPFKYGKIIPQAGLNCLGGRVNTFSTDPAISRYVNSTYRFKPGIRTYINLKYLYPVNSHLLFGGSYHHIFNSPVRFPYMKRLISVSLNYRI